MSVYDSTPPDLSNYEDLLGRALDRGWKTPPDGDPYPFKPIVWIRYWQACDDYERDPQSGRPVPPHRPA